jgi:hypothetical protein
MVYVKTDRTGQQLWLAPAGSEANQRKAVAVKFRDNLTSPRSSASASTFAEDTRQGHLDCIKSNHAYIPNIERNRLHEAAACTVASSKPWAYEGHNLKSPSM